MRRLLSRRLRRVLRPLLRRRRSRPGLVGALNEALRICYIEQDRGRLIVPHCWKTAIYIAAWAHPAAGVPNCPSIEYLPAELCASPLQQELATNGMTFKDGLLSLHHVPASM